jgi:hypothetical protein
MWREACVYSFKKTTVILDGLRATERGDMVGLISFCDSSQLSTASVEVAAADSIGSAEAL